MRRRSGQRTARQRQIDRDFAELHLRVGHAFGPHLRKLRERARLSQDELAGERYDRSFIAKLEAGVSLPSVHTLGELASVLGSSPRALIPKEL